MVTIIEEAEILSLIEDIDLPSKMADGFVKYSNNLAVVPSVGELLFEKAKGEAHIKYGYIEGRDYYTIKIASGFYNNPELGISSSQGLMLLFSQKTGELVAILLDNGKLTDLRTAAAGALVARTLGPQEVDGIGILGTGIQAELQLEFLIRQELSDLVYVWGRNKDHTLGFKRKFEGRVTIRSCQSPTEVAQNCNLIVTTTPSNDPLLVAKDIRSGTHITAVGSDTASKQELDTDLLAKADLVVVDSISQSQSRGEVFQATQAGVISHEEVVELGLILMDPGKFKRSNESITIADLTGVAVQDIMISEAVYEQYLKQNKK